MEAIVFAADPITWKSQDPVWVEQWPLHKEKLLAAKALIFEQLELGHIEPSNSPWNTPIFVIKKKSGKRRLLQDLRAINATMEDMGALQPGLPSPVAVPEGYNIIVIDLQDCFFTTPLNPEDKKRFAFSLPSENLKQPYLRFQWKVLPQGMKNSPTLCQKFVNAALQDIRVKYEHVYMIHYMDDILIAHPDRVHLQTVLQDLTQALTDRGLKIAPEKIQINPPITYLGRVINSETVTHTPLQLRKDHLITLNDYQKLLGDINWIRPYLKLTTAELKPLFNILRGDPDPTSKRQLTAEAQEALGKVEAALSNSYVKRIDLTMTWQFLCLATPVAPTGVLWQGGPLEWIHLPTQAKKVVASYPGSIATLMLKGRKRSIELFGKEPSEIVIPYNKEQLDALLMFDEDWQIAIGNYCGQILHHLPSHVLLNFMSNHPVIFPVRCKQFPISDAQVVFTDGSANGRASIVTRDHQKLLETQETSAQRAEITAVIEAFVMFAEKEFNLYSDSQYVVRLFPHIETAVLPENKTAIYHLLTRLQQQIWKRNRAFFIGHIRAHSGLPGPLNALNELADSLTRISVASVFEEARASHSLHHQNATALRYQFQIPRESAREIVRSCSHCPTTVNALPLGVNPRGLKPNALWQMDVTHVSSFGKLSFVHVTVDTFSHVIIATARTGEAVKDVIQHLFTCFSYLGLPKALKTDNAPAYTSKSFQQFCTRFQIKHNTGIPYNPQGQAIVERAHQTLKIHIQKLKEGEFKYSSPHQILKHALFVINNLNTDSSGNTAMLRHWCPEQLNAKPLVKWRDLLSGQWKGPDPLLTSGRGYACVFPQDADAPIWVPDRLIRHVSAPRISESPATAISKKEETPSSSAPPASTGNAADPRTADIGDPG